MALLGACLKDARQLPNVYKICRASKFARNPQNVSELPESHQKGYVGWVIGGSYFTKMLPAKKVIEIGRKIDKSVVLLGGPEDKDKGNGNGARIRTVDLFAIARNNECFIHCLG